MKPVYQFNDVARWRGYRLVLEQTFSSDYFFEEYRLVMAIDHWRSNKLKKNKKRVTESHMRSDLARYLFLSKYARGRNVGPDTIREHIDRLDFSPENQSLWDQIDILIYIAEGTWMDIQLAPGDIMYVGRFEREERLPILWIVFSVNLEQKYLRLHAWSRSLMTDLLYQSYFEHGEEIPPRSAGRYVLSKLLDLSRVDVMYTSPKESTLHVLGKMAGPTVLDREWLIWLEEGNVHGEECQINVTNHMRLAWSEDVEVIDLTRCILCNAPNAGFYTEHLGQGIRFCGARASRTASAQGLLGQ